MEAPTLIAREIAELLRRDPIMAASIREFVPDDELYDLLSLPKVDNFEDDEDDEDDEDTTPKHSNVLGYVVKHCSLSEVLAAFRTARK